MGYTTEFEGVFGIEPPLKPEHKAMIEKIANTDWRDEERMPGMPTDDYHSYCQWTTNFDGTAIEWDGNEKFYGYIEWLKFLCDLLKEWGYALNGESEWFGESHDDRGKLQVCANELKVFKGKVMQYEEITYEEAAN